MPKQKRKLVVYLDQNFLSEIAKASVNDKKDRLQAVVA